MTTVDRELIKDEERRIGRLRFIVDLTEATLLQMGMDLDRALDLVATTRHAALTLFPDKESVYDLVCSPRFRRILCERFPEYRRRLN